MVSTAAGANEHPCFARKATVVIATGFINDPGNASGPFWVLQDDDRGKGISYFKTRKSRPRILCDDISRAVESSKKTVMRTKCPDSQLFLEPLKHIHKSVGKDATNF